METNRSFLYEVLTDLVEKAGGLDCLQQYTLVFPMQRAGLFFKQELKRYLLSVQYSKPVVLPHITTLDALVDSLCPLQPDEELVSICRLYHIFQHHTKKADMPLDVFYGWGKQLLTDFSNVDMAVPNASELFANAVFAHDLERLDISPDTLERLQALFPHNDDVFTKDDSVKQQFEQLWKAIPDVYKEFTSWQRQNNIAYRGARFRYVLSHIDDGSIVDGLSNRVYAFIGFNYLLSGELELMQALRKQGKALFYWDYRQGFSTCEGAYKFLVDNMASLPNALSVKQEQDKVMRVDVIAASSLNAQAQYVHQWLLDNHHDGERTAVVIADEALLESVIYALPAQWSGRINITKGYPLRNTKVFADVCDYLSDVQHDKHGDETYKDVLERMLVALQSQEQFEPELTGELRQTWQWTLMQEAFYQVRVVVNRFCALIADHTLDDINTLKALRNILRRHLETVTIPFHGEPLTEIQVIGVLETRLLDFDNVLVLNVEEGVLPKVSVDNSFIPYYLRKYYRMQTKDEEALVYAYNFFRLLRRADKVSLLFSDAATAMGKKTMSRFLIQIMTSDEFTVSRYRLIESAVADDSALPYIDKNVPHWLARFDKECKQPSLSPSAITTYLTCRRKFYFEQVLCLRTAQQQGALLQPNEIGSLIHATIFHAYKSIFAGQSMPVAISKKDIDSYLADEERLSEALHSAYTTLNEDYNRHHPDYKADVPFYVYEQHKVENLVVSQHVHKVLSNDALLAPFTMIDMEHYCTCPVSVTLESGETMTVNIGGFIDRMDIIHTNEGDYIRILDYKTGKYDDKKMSVKDMETVFKQGTDKHYMLQTLVYCLAAEDVVRTSVSGALPITAGLLFTAKSLNTFDWHLYFGEKADKHPMEDFADVREDFVSALRALVKGIIEEREFAQCSPTKCVPHCPFALLCGRDEVSTSF